MAVGLLQGKKCGVCCHFANEGILLAAEVNRWELECSFEHDYKIEKEMEKEEQRAKKYNTRITAIQRQHNMVKSS